MPGGSQGAMSRKLQCAEAGPGLLLPAMYPNKEEEESQIIAADEHASRAYSLVV